MNYIWRKYVTADWLAHQGESLERRFGSTFAIIQHRGQSRVTIEIACGNNRAGRRLEQELGGKVVKLPADWLEGFSATAKKKPLRIGSRLLVFASANQSRSYARTGVGCRSIIIPAETAFGTGEHATTAMCLRLLEQFTRSCEPAWRMLDVGTGSGILGIAASNLGATRVVAIDTDPLACTVAKRNAHLNGVGNVNFVNANILSRKSSEKFDVITANLFSDLLIDAMPAWERHLAPNGTLIFSGLLRSQEAATVRAFREHHFSVAHFRRRGKWVAAVARRLNSESGS